MDDVERESAELNDSSEKKPNQIELRNYRSLMDRGSSRLREAMWIACKCVFFMPYYPIPSIIRVGILRFFGAKVGASVVIRAGVNIAFPWRLIVGNYVWIGEGVTLLNLAEIVIESNCCISQRAFLCTGSHDFYSQKFDLITKPIRVLEGSWIAANAFIAPGVEIGPGSMVGAGCVVTRRVEAGSVMSAPEPRRKQ